jgi:ATP-dependent DNA helicase RecG
MTDLNLSHLLTAPRANTVLLGGDVSPAELARHAVGLANAKGGTLVVGVTLEGTLEGASDVHPLQLTHAVFELTHGRLTVHCASNTLDGKPLLIVSVPKSPIVLATPQGEVLHWNGHRLEPLGAAEAEPAPEPDFTATVPPTSSLSDLDPLEVHRLRSVLGSRRGAQLAELPDLDLLRALGVLDGDQPNLAGILLAGTARALQRYVPQSELDYYFHETADLEFEFRETILKSLPALLERLRELIQARNRYKSLQVGLFRIEVWDFDEVVYREAILNALVHRDYTSRDTVQIHHHPDRLEVSNPGSFAGGVNPDNILRHAPKRRNPVLAEALARLGYIERAGIGVDRMYRLLLQHGKEPPEYTSYTDSVVLMLRNPEFDEGFTRFVARKQEEMGALTLDTLIVLSNLKREREADRETLSCALQLTPDKLPRLLRPLEDAGLIERQVMPERWTLSREALSAIGVQGVASSIASGRGLSGVSTRSASVNRQNMRSPRASATSSLSRSAREQRVAYREGVLALVDAQGSVANRDVRTLLGLSLNSASHLLRAMVREGSLNRIGLTPKAARYQRVSVSSSKN